MRTYAVAACRLLYLGLTALAIAGVSGLPTAVFGQPMAGPIPPGSYAGVHEEPPVAHETARATSMYWSLFPSIAKLRLREGQQVEAPQGEIIREIRVDGNTFLEDETVQFFLSFVEGDAFDWATAQQNFRTMLKEITDACKSRGIEPVGTTMADICDMVLAEPVKMKPFIYA